MNNSLVIGALLLLFSFSALAQDSLNISKLSDWKDESITSSSLYDNTYNEVWGYASNGREYAIIGSSRGTHFFDITNPSSPVMVDFVEGRVSCRY